MSKIWIAAFAAAAILMMTRESDAGLSNDGWSVSCSQNVDHSGWCAGTFRAFRNSSDPNAYASFDSYWWGGRAFYATLNGVNAYCVPNANVSTLWTQAATFDGWFQIEWDSGYNCTYLLLFNGSQYHNSF